MRPLLLFVALLNLAGMNSAFASCPEDYFNSPQTKNALKPAQAMVIKAVNALPLLKKNGVTVRDRGTIHIEGDGVEFRNILLSNGVRTSVIPVRDTDGILQLLKPFYTRETEEVYDEFKRVVTPAYCHFEIRSYFQDAILWNMDSDKRIVRFSIPELEQYREKPILVKVKLR